MLGKSDGKSRATIKKTFEQKKHLHEKKKHPQKKRDVSVPLFGLRKEKIFCAALTPLKEMLRMSGRKVKYVKKEY